MVQKFCLVAYTIVERYRLWMLVQAGTATFINESVLGIISSQKCGQIFRLRLGQKIIIAGIVVAVE